MSKGSSASGRAHVITGDRRRRLVARPTCRNHRPGAVGAPVVAGHVVRIVSGHNLGMIFVLDTNVLLSNAKFQSGWWTDFVSRVTELGGRIVVPAVVLEETIANHNRRLRGLISSFRDVGKREKSLGIEAIHDAVEAAIVTKTDDFGPALRRYLDDADVEIADPPEVPHMTIIERATAFRKPFDGQERKDGYRDTLIWFTVMDIAEKAPGVEVWFVSQNKDDFGDGSDEPNWHAQILEDLSERGLEERVRWQFNVPTLLVAIADRTAPVPETDTDAVTDKVDLVDLAKLLSVEVLGRPLHPRRAALPVQTESAEITSIHGSVRDVEWDEVVQSSSGGLLAEFTTSVDVGLELVVGSSSEDDGQRFINKSLLVSGVATLTSNGEVTAVSITGIRAHEDDPGRAAWTAFDDHVSTLGGDWHESVADVLSRNRAAVSAGKSIAETVLAAQGQLASASIADTYLSMVGKLASASIAESFSALTDDQRDALTFLTHSRSFTEAVRSGDAEVLAATMKARAAGRVPSVEEIETARRAAEFAGNNTLDPATAEAVSRAERDVAKIDPDTLRAVRRIQDSL